MGLVRRILRSISGFFSSTMWKMYLEALGLLLLWMAVPALCFFAVSLYKTKETGMSSDDKSRAVATLEVEESIIFFSHPNSISFDPEKDNPEPLSVWAHYKTPTLGPSPTIDPKSTVVATPTPAGYVVSIRQLDEMNSLSFLDEKGRDIPPQMIITPSVGDVTPRVIYIQPNQAESTQVALEAKVGETRTDPIYIELKKKSDLKILFDFLIGPFTGTTFLIALAGFGFQQWQQYQKKKDEDEKKKEEVEKEVGEFIKLIKSDMSEAARQYKDKVEPK